MSKWMSRGWVRGWVRTCISKDWVMNNDSCESKVKIERKVNYKVKIGDGEEDQKRKKEHNKEKS